MGTLMDESDSSADRNLVLDEPKASRYSWEDLLNWVQANSLRLLDRGFYYFYQPLISQKIAFITRIKKRAFYPNEQVLTPSYDIKDRIIKIGSGTKKTPIVTVRLVEVRSGKTWLSYLTSVLDPQILLPYVVAFISTTLANRVGFLYSKTSALFKLFMDWFSEWSAITNLGRLFYEILVDLGDAVAEEL